MKRDSLGARLVGFAAANARPRPPVLALLSGWTEMTERLQRDHKDRTVQLGMAGRGSELTQSLLKFSDSPSVSPSFLSRVPSIFEKVPSTPPFLSCLEPQQRLGTRFDDAPTTALRKLAAAHWHKPL